MENHTTTKSKLNLMKFLPKVANAVVSFQNPQFSPCRDKLTKSHFNNRGGFSGPMMIPIEARTRKSKNNFIESQQEPTSPKVSCIGQIKHKKCMNNKKKQSNNNSVSKDLIKVVEIKPDLKQKQKQKKKKSLFKSSSFKNIFNSRRRSDADRVKSAGSELAAPSLGQMRRFASSRDAFASFDWTANAQIAPDDDDEDDDFRVPFSAPILFGDLEPRKEINLWKRRTMAKPEPLQLNVVNKL